MAKDKIVEKLSWLTTHNRDYSLNVCRYEGLSNIYQNVLKEYQSNDLQDALALLKSYKTDIETAIKELESSDT